MSLLPKNPWPKDSAGYAEWQDMVAVCVGAFVISVAIFLTVFVFHTDLWVDMHASPTWMNVLGGVGIFGSVVPLYLASKSMDGIGNYVWAWLILMALGTLCSCGFFSYTY